MYIVEAWYSTRDISQSAIKRNLKNCMGRDIFNIPVEISHSGNDSTESWTSYDVTYSVHGKTGKKKTIYPPQIYNFFYLD